MKQKIKLTKENDGTIHVDDVDVSKGVYAKSSTGVLFLFSNENGYIFTRRPDNTSSGVYSSLKEFIEAISNEWATYTLSGLRIVTEKELSVEDLKDGDHVGFIDDSERKGYVTWVSKAGYVPVSITDYNSKMIGNFSNGAETLYKSLQYAITRCDDKPTDLYRFTTRKELYAWLAE